MTTLRIELSSAHNAAATPNADGEYPIEVLRQRLIEDAVYPSGYRYNDTLDEFQFYRVSDGAWIDAPGSDPRVSTVFPPLTGASRRCNSAHSVRYWLQNTYIPLIVNGLNGLASAAFIAAQIVAALAHATTINFAYFISLALDIATAALAQGATAIAAAMTNTVFNTFECILYCRMTTDGQLTASSLAQVRTDTLAAFSGDAESILIGILTLGDAGGFNGLAAQGFDVGHCASCGACTDWSHTFDFTKDNGGFSPFLPLQANYIAGLGWSYVDRTQSGTDHSRLAYITRNIPGAATITKIAYTFTYVAGTFDAAVDRVRVVDDVTTIANSAVAIVSGIRSFQWTGSRFMNLFSILARCSRQAAAAWNGSVVITSCTLTGTGNDPFL